MPKASPLWPTCTTTSRAEAVVGLIAPTTTESTYVLFELGASWSGESKTLPFLIKGATPELVPDPLRELNIYSLESVQNCWKLIDDIDGATKLDRSMAPRQRIEKAVARLAEAAKR